MAGKRRNAAALNAKGVLNCAKIRFIAKNAAAAAPAVFSRQRKAVQLRAVCMRQIQDTALIVKALYEYCRADCMIMKAPVRYDNTLLRRLI